MATSLKTAIENTLALAIMDFAGVGGTQLDPALPADQRLKEATGGYLLLDKDKGKAPLVRIKVMKMEKTVDSIGYGDEGRSYMGNALVRVAGLVAVNNSIDETIEQRDLLEDVIRTNLVRVDLSSAATSGMSGSKSEYSAGLYYLSTEFGEEVATAGITKGVDYAAFFSQEWQMTIDVISGS